MPEVLTELAARMQNVVDALSREFASIRTGRATPALLDNIIVDYQGEPVPLRQMANITVPEASLLIIQPWDRNLVKAIEKAILKANIGVSPSTDANLVRVVIPSLSEERRVELAKLLTARVEDYRVMLRNLRRDAIGKIRKMERDKELSQDQLKNTTRQIDQLTNDFVDRVNQVGKDKEKEIKEI